MKKFLLLSALALGLMTSCSDEEYIPSSSIDANSIAFSTQPKAATRSGSTITSLEKFTVDAINTDGSKYFSGTEFVFNSNMGVFQSNTPYYWPTTNTLSFYAINAPGTVSYNEQNIPEYTYQYWGGETDLVAAAVRSGEKRIPYPLTFKHLTSQIYVSAEAENKVEDLTYKLVSVKMTTPSSGTYSFATQTDGVGTWDIDNSSCSEYSYNKELPVSFLKNGHVDFSSLYWNILPLKEGTIQFKIEYQVIQNGKIISDLTGNNAKTCIIENPNLMPGKRYIYNFVLARQTNDEITFTLSVVDWGEEVKTDLNPATLPNVISLSHTKVVVEQKSKKLLYVASVIPAEASKEVTWSSADPNIATVDAETGEVKGINVGITTITATTPNGVSKSCEVEVVEHDSYNGHDFVDLGLPSGLKWASMNVGATSVEEAGYYFAWGEIEGHCLNKVLDYRFCSNNYSMSEWTGNLDLEHDAARANMGGDWRMPSYADINELSQYTNHTTDYVNGVIGVRYTSRKNPDNSIFLPETGFWNNQYSATQDRDHIGIGRYWSSSSSVNGGNTVSFANTLECHDNVSTNNGSYYRYCGLAVRGVCE